MPDGVPAAAFSGMKIVSGNDAALYSEVKPKKEKAELKAVPYCLWNNRGRGEMAVWIKTV